MSNYNFYPRNFHGNTFQNLFVPPPPMPPPFFMPPLQQWLPEQSDQEYVKQFVKPTIKAQKQKSLSISEVKEKISTLILTVKKLKMIEKCLIEKVDDLTDEEWHLKLQDIDKNKAIITKVLGRINNLNMEVLRKLLLKRSAKRCRQKRQRIEKKRAKEEWIKQNKENSRKIDEHLQKIQDDINKAKQEEDAKLKADFILRETIRKKQDAKKYIVKLDALAKLRKAKQNTAKGRGENISEREEMVFENNIEKLKNLWARRLTLYEKEESELRSQLTQTTEELSTVNNQEKEVVNNIEQWKEVLFGGVLPQVNFGGDVGRFVAIRSQWDQYLSIEGSSLPIGWVPPKIT